MKTFRAFVPQQPAPGQRAFNLIELMTALSLFSVLLVGLLGSHLFGLRLQRITETKLSATGSARNALNQVRDAIRSAKMLEVGVGDATSFAPIGDNSNRIGNALQIYPTTDTNFFFRIYHDASDNKLKRRASNEDSEEVVASYITNHLVFSAEDFQGRVLTNHQDNRVIRLSLELYQWEFPLATAGAGSMYDYFRLNTRITRRTIE